MLTEIKYNPASLIPYEVRKKVSKGWLLLGNFADETSACTAALRVSREPDLPCLIAQYKNGIKVEVS